MPELDLDALPPMAQHHILVMATALKEASSTSYGPTHREALAAAQAAFTEAARASVSPGWTTDFEEEAVDFTTVVALRVKEHRIIAEVTQATLASLMTRLGFETWTRVTVAEVERGTRRVTLEEMLALAALFAVPMVEFLVPQWESLKYPILNAVDGSIVVEMLTGTSDGPNWAPAVFLTLDEPGSEWRPAHRYWANRVPDAAAHGNEPVHT